MGLKLTNQSTKNLIQQGFCEIWAEVPTSTFELLSYNCAKFKLLAYKSPTSQNHKPLEANVADEKTTTNNNEKKQYLYLDF
jgi:hypothetical protein